MFTSFVAFLTFCFKKNMKGNVFIIYLETYCFQQYKTYSSLFIQFLLPSSFVSRNLTHENHSILVHFDLVLHLIEQVFLQVVTHEGIELLFSKTPQ